MMPPLKESVVTYRDEGSANAGRTYVGTNLSGTSISFGSSNNFDGSCYCSIACEHVSVSKILQMCMCQMKGKL